MFYGPIYMDPYSTSVNMTYEFEGDICSSDAVRNILTLAINSSQLAVLLDGRMPSVISWLFDLPTTNKRMEVFNYMSGFICFSS